MRSVSSIKSSTHPQNPNPRGSLSSLLDAAALLSLSAPPTPPPVAEFTVGNMGGGGGEYALRLWTGMSRCSTATPLCSKAEMAACSKLLSPTVRYFCISSPSNSQWCSKWLFCNVFPRDHACDPALVVEHDQVTKSHGAKEAVHMPFGQLSVQIIDFSPSP